MKYKSLFASWEHLHRVMLTRVLILHAQSVDCTQGQISLSNCAEISGKFRNIIFIIRVTVS